MPKLKLKLTSKALIIESPEEERMVEVTKKYDRNYYDQLVEHFELSFITKNQVYFNGNILENGKLIIQNEIK
jgi:hypothetical protein